jgi:hypothetical protein
VAAADQPFIHFISAEAVVSAESLACKSLGASELSGCSSVALSPEDVVDLERLVDLGEPLGAIGGAAAAAFVERQF